MADHPLITDYLTPLPPFMAGSNAIDKAISDIWAKRKQDEDLRREAAQQEALQAYEEGMVGVGELGALESTRHNRATEAHSFGTLQRDINNDQVKYLADIATAYNDRKQGLGDALSNSAGLLGIAPRAMAAPVVGPESGVPAQGDPNAATRGPEPGVVMGAPQPNNGSAIAGGQPMTPPYAAPVQPQQAAPAPPQAELNAPKPPAEPQPAGDPNAPPAPAPMPPQQAAPPQQQAAPPQQQAAPGQQVRREDIHNPPLPPSQLGVEAPVAPGTPAALPAMPYANDPRKNPIAREADPGWEGRAPTQFPGGVARPTGTPETGPLDVGASGGVDPAMQRQWLLQHGVVGRGVLPDGQAMMTADQRRVNQSLQVLNSYARDEVEREMARAAIENGTAAAAVMPADKAYNGAVKQFNHSVDLYNKNVRATEQAGAQQGRFDQTQMVRQGESFLADQEKLYADRGIPKMLARYKAAKDLQSILANADPNSAEWQQTVRGFLESMENRGAVTDEDIRATSGESNSSILERVMGKIQVWLTGVPGPQRENIRQAITRMIPIMEDQAADEFEVLSRYIAGAPNAYYEDRARRRNEAIFGTYGWGAGGFKAERAGQFRGPPAVKPPTATRPKPRTSSASSSSGPPSPTSSEPPSPTSSEPPDGTPPIPGYNYTPPKGSR